MGRKRIAPNCPECDKPMKPIAYGLPGESMIESAMRGEIILGGCIIKSTNPQFGCLACDIEIGALGD